MSLERMLKLGDKFYLNTGKKPFLFVEVVGFKTQGDQLHGEPMQMVKVKVLLSGHSYKKGMIYVMQTEAILTGEAK